jgi:hypothetical protein
MSVASKAKTQFNWSRNKNPPFFCVFVRSLPSERLVWFGWNFQRPSKFRNFNLLRIFKKIGPVVYFFEDSKRSNSQSINNICNKLRKYVDCIEIHISWKIQTCKSSLSWIVSILKLFFVIFWAFLSKKLDTYRSSQFI